MAKIIMINTHNLKYNMCKCKVCAIKYYKVKDYNINCAYDGYKT